MRLDPDMLSAPTAEESAAVAAHFAYLTELKDRGTLMLAGRTLTVDEHCFGLVIFEAASEADARRIMADDPAVQRGVMRAELHPYRIALMGRAPDVP